MSNLDTGRAPLVLPLARDSRPHASDHDCVFLCYDSGPVLFQLPHETRQFLASALPDEVGPWPFLVYEFATGQELVLAAEGCPDTDAQAIAWYLLRDYGAEALQLEPLDAHQYAALIA